MALRSYTANALILPGELPGYREQKNVLAEEASRRRREQQSEEDRLYQRQRLERQDARQAVLDEREDATFAQGQADAERKRRLEQLQAIYTATKDIADPQQFEALKPRLRQIVPDIDGETFETLQQINQLGAQLFGPQPEVRTVGGSLVRVNPDLSVEEMYAPPEKPQAAPSGYRWKADGSGLELIPGYAEGQGTLTGTRRQELVSRPMPSRAKTGGKATYTPNDIKWD